MDCAVPVLYCSISTRRSRKAFICYYCGVKCMSTHVHHGKANCLTLADESWSTTVVLECTQQGQGEGEGGGGGA